MSTLSFLYFNKTNIMNRVERWYKRNTLEALYRKMQEWNTQSVEDFFIHIFHDQLNEEEKKWARHLQLEFDYQEWYWNFFLIQHIYWRGGKVFSYSVFAPV